MLLLLCRQGAWPNKRPRPMPAGPGGKGVVVEFLARDSSHGPAEAGHAVEVDFAHRGDHGALIPWQTRKIKRCADIGCILGASTLAPAHYDEMKFAYPRRSANIQPRPNSTRMQKA